MGTETAALSTLLAAVSAADLAATLDGPGTFTVFAPTNDAFAKIPADALNGLLADKPALTNVLLRHVLGSVVMAADIPPGATEIETLSGDKITITNANGGVTITNMDGTVSNVIA